MKYCFIAVVMGFFSAILFSGCDPISSGSSDATNAAKLREISTAEFQEFVIDSKKPVLVDFWAPWCPPCVALTPKLEKIAAKYEGEINVFKVNVDDNRELSAKFNVTSIPRLVYFKDGEVIIDSGRPTEGAIERDIQQIIALK